MLLYAADNNAHREFSIAVLFRSSNGSALSSQHEKQVSVYLTFSMLQTMQVF